MRVYQVVRSKMAKTGVLLKDPVLARYIPKTVPYTRDNLESMLKKYQRVFVKPDRGRGGKRVISIQLDDKGLCSIHYEKLLLQGKQIGDAAALIKKVAAGEQFIIQQGIKLLSIDHEPFDLRINVQKPYNRWEVTAMIAKIRARGKPVTNYSQGGKLVEIKQSLKRAGLKKDDVDQLLALLTYLGEKTAGALEKQYPALRELGVDVGLDQQARPWIFEVNTRPQYPPGLDKKFDRYRRIIQQRTVVRYQDK